MKFFLIAVILFVTSVTTMFAQEVVEEGVLGSRSGKLARPRCLQVETWTSQMLQSARESTRV
jgi:hypothetical protein